MAGDKGRHAGLRAGTASLHGSFPWATGRFEYIGASLSLQLSV